MSQGFIVGKGGMNKGTVKKSAIFVKYLVGSICTVTGNGKAYTARDTSGAAAFIVEPGIWTVTANDGSVDLASKTVEITYVGQIVSVVLGNKLWLYNKGDECSDITDGWTSSVGRSNTFTLGTMTKKETSIRLSLDSAPKAVTAIPTNKIDLSAYSTLYCNIIANSANESVLLQVRELTTGSNSALAESVSTTVGVIALDVSEFDGMYYVGPHIYSSKSSDTRGYIEFDEIWLEI